MEGEERWKVEGGGVEWGGREVEGRWSGRKRDYLSSGLFVPTLHYIQITLVDT